MSKVIITLLVLLLGLPVVAAKKIELQKATFAGGCFWCMEHPFEKLAGVKTVISGYTGGKEKNPTYKQVSSGTTGHVEAVQVTYNPVKVSYKKLLDVFWRQIDPTDAGGQFVDRGRQYRSAIFYHNDAQQQLAEESKKELAQSGRFSRKLVTDILPAKEFYLAEGYHQDYYKTHSVSYKFYRYRSGRDQFLEKIWVENKMKKKEKMGRPSDQELKNKLTPMQFHVTREDGTEPPFKNAYWDNKRPGIYVDIISGEPLFSSLEQYKSGTGWPSFIRPLEPANIVERKESFLPWSRTEVRSEKGDNHIGHIFNDGPQPTGLRYCMNSAALRFIPVEDLEKEGYGRYKSLFGK